MTAQTKAGQIKGISIKETTKGDLFVVDIDGTEYSTFKREVADEAKKLIGQPVEFSFNEKEVTKDGRNYTNRYFEGAVLRSMQQTLPVSNGDYPAHGGEADRQLRIMRQTGTKVAVLLLPFLKEERERTPEGLLLVSEYLVAYYQNGLPEPEPEPDDDIPF